MQAPVGSAATARLASEVSQAGGLGALGASWTDPGVLRERIRSITRVTDRPFCVNLVLDFEQDERLEVAVEERAPIVSFSFGLSPQLIARATAISAVTLSALFNGALRRHAGGACDFGRPGRHRVIQDEREHRRSQQQPAHGHRVYRSPIAFALRPRR